MTRPKCALCECAVANFSSSRTAHGANFSNRIGREVVEVHIALRLLVLDAVHGLRVSGQAERRNRHDLRLATAEHS